MNAYEPMKAVVHTPAVVKVLVSEPFRLVHAGNVFTGGDTAEVPDHVAAEWVHRGWATEVSAAEPDEQRGSVRGQRRAR
jgi:hypothetical protein